MRSASPRALLATASVAVALASADTYVVVLALPDMMAGVGLGIDELQRATPIISGFLLGYIAVLPLIGRLSDLASRQSILLACLVVFVVGSAITAVSVELPVLVGGRVLQGIGGGGLVPATLALVADLWPPERRGTPLGVVGAVQELGSVLGPLLGAAVLAVADWRAIFWLNVVLGSVIAAVLVLTGGREARPQLRVLPTVLGLATLAAGLLTLVAPTSLADDVTLGIPFVPFVGAGRLATPMGVFTVVLLVATMASLARSPVASGSLPALWRRVDLLGAFCIAVALGALVLTFASADPEREVVGPWSWALVPLGLVAVAAYLWRHRTARDPLVPRGLMATGSDGGRSSLIPALLVSLLVGVALVGIVVDIPVLARLTVTGSQTVAALVLVRFLVAVPVGAFVGGWLLHRFGPAVVAAAGLILAGTGLMVMSGWGHGSLQSWSATPVLVLVGLGLGLPIAPVNAAALASASDDAHGLVSALVVLARMVGMVVGLGLLTAIGLYRYYRTVAALPDQSDTAALAAAGVVQVQTVFFGGALAALAAAVFAMVLGQFIRARSPGAKSREMEVSDSRSRGNGGRDRGRGRSGGRPPRPARR
ncbi:MAG: MFS transporter [Dermatophilaceae bacterium]